MGGAMDLPPDYVNVDDEDFEVLNEKFTSANFDDGSDEETLIIGLDFGTTYSGVAYAITTKPDTIYLVDEWPGARGRTYSKCPSLIKYDEKGFKWGFELDRTTTNRIEGVKLLLDPEQRKPVYVPAINAEAEIKKLGKPATTVASDYIGAIFKHALEKIESKFPLNYINLLKKQYVLSVPAVWSDKAKDATLKAARNAGIHPVKLIKEPEAAALFTLHGQGDKGLNVGDAFVLCDAGGGTVDLISYEITSLHPFELVELTISTGGLAGSLMVNRRFEEWIKEVVGNEAFQKLKETDAYRRAMKDFDENVKPGFRSRDDETCYVNFPKANLKDNEAMGLESNTLAVTGEVLHNIYEPIFKAIDDLIKAQVADARLKRLRKGLKDGYDIKAIFLVGGFGSNTYLYEKVRDAHPDVQVIQPNDAWSAIVRGAVMSQLPTEAQVVANIAPKHYGVAATTPYDEKRDVGRIKTWDQYEELYRVETMTWYIEKGDDLLRSRKIEFPFFRVFEPNPTRSELQIVDTLLECPFDTKPIHPREDAVKKNCRLRTDLSSVPLDQFKRKSRVSRLDGTTKTWWELHYKLLVTIQSGPMVFSLQCGGKEYGQSQADY